MSTGADVAAPLGLVLKPLECLGAKEHWPSKGSNVQIAQSTAWSLSWSGFTTHGANFRERQLSKKCQPLRRFPLMSLDQGLGPGVEASRPARHKPPWTACTLVHKSFATFPTSIGTVVSLQAGGRRSANWPTKRLGSWSTLCVWWERRKRILCHACICSTISTNHRYLHLSFCQAVSPSPQSWHKDAWSCNGL